MSDSTTESERKFSMEWYENIYEKIMSLAARSARLGNDKLYKCRLEKADLIAERMNKKANDNSNN